MGLVYNHKNKHDLVVLSEQELENNEAELCDFVIVPDEPSDEEKLSATDTDGNRQK